MGEKDVRIARDHLVYEGVHSAYTTSSPSLRFVKRGDRAILQYMEVRRYHDKVENVWVNVPMEESE